MADRAAGGVATSVAPPPTTFGQRLAQGLRFALTGTAPDFFGPARPIAPAAQEAAIGRAFDFPAGYNLQIRPRPYEPVSFAELRGLADAYDLVRLAIETRKDQMAHLDWSIQARDTGAKDATATKLQTFFAQPDREHDFLDWQRMLLEDLLVIDAPAIYVRPTRGGQVYALEIIDGATIKRVIDDRGRTPVPPDPAYQQILKGIPAVDYTSDELIYRPRNVRSNRIYGFSPVEQLLTIVNIALRRQVSQLNYYTDGNIPDALAGVPATWTTQQIEQFQAHWDALLADDLAARRRLRFVPGEFKWQQLKTESLFDEFDEWLARVVMFCFSLPALPFVKQQNRATAATAQESAEEEGLAPLKVWQKTLMDRLLAGPLRSPGYEFVWGDQESVDPLVQAQVDHIYVTDGVRTRNEIRANLGDAPMEGGDELAAPAAPGGGNPAGAEDEEAQKLAKAASDRATENDRRARSPRTRVREGRPDSLPRGDGALGRGLVGAGEGASR